MKLKGVNFFEQHVEKIVLGTVSVVFLGVVAMQFLYEPNKIKVGTADPVPPGRAFIPLEEQARQIKGKIDATAEALSLPAVPKVELVDQFKAKHSGPVAPADTIVAFGKVEKAEGADPGRITPKGTQPVQALAVAAPTSPVAAAFCSTLDPVETLSYPELKSLVPAEQPMDKAAVSVEARFDGTALKAALLGTSTGGDDKAIALPAMWWRDQMEILGVKVERQEQTASGEWGQSTDVPQMPGRGIPDLVKNIRGQADLGDAISAARAGAEEVLRPAYYHTIAGVAWKPPSDMVKSVGAAQSPEVKKLIDARKREIAQQESTQKAIEAAEKAATTPRNVPTPTTGGGGGGKGGAGGGAGAAQPSPRDTTKESDRQKKQLQDRLKKIEESLTKNEEALKALGANTEGGPLATPVSTASGAAAAPAKSLLDTANIQLWAHDLTATPGKTYRYRVKVQVTNPAFGRAGALVAEQQDMAKSPVIESAPSAWTEPVSVLASKYFFITSATEGDTQGPARATAELYQFFYGYYRKSQPLYLEPGDVLVAAVKLPEKEKLPIYDLSGLAANPDQQQPPAGSPAANPGSVPGIPTKLGGKGSNQPVDESGGGRNRAPAAGQAGAAAQNKPTLPANAKPWTNPVRAEFDVFLLDAAKVPGEGGPKVQAYLRNEAGVIVCRAPSEDERADTYRILTASAKEGENQGQPAAVVEKKPDNQVNPPPTRGERPPPPPGGGGGGGGGGG